MKAGQYLRLRREASGLSPRDVAVMISERPCWQNFNEGAIVEIEAGRWLPDPAFVDRMRRAFAFDRFIVRQLVCRVEPYPQICLECGCSGLDPCDDEATGPCGWATAKHDLCTHCAERAHHPKETAHA